MKLIFLLNALSWSGGELARSYAADTSLESAESVANIMGIGRDGKCSSCHALNSSDTLKRWSTAFNRVEKCRSDNPASSTSQLECIAEKTLATTSTLSLKPAQLGFYAAGIHLAPISTLITDHYGPTKGASILSSLKATVAMPLRSPELLTEGEFEQIVSWAKSGMPHLNDLLLPYEGPKVCEAFVDPDLKDHLKAMALDGWQARNEANRMLMYACSATDGICFAQQRNGQDLFPDVSTQATMKTWKSKTVQQLRVLTEITDTTVRYWARSSADGRFVAYGGTPSGIIDLQGQLAATPKKRVIKVEALYDPAFFPDDSAFVFQGKTTGFCNMNILKNSATNSINFSEDACTDMSTTRIPLYQAIGASLDGDDYLAATSSYNRDPGLETTVGEHFPSSGLDASATSKLNLYPLTFDGEQWQRLAPQIFLTPWEIDWGLSHSNRLMISRLQGKVNAVVKTVGYNLYKMSRDDSLNYSKKQVAKICIDGLKGDFSFDDRFFATYAYISADQWQALGYSSPQDPEFKARLAAGTANVFMYDLYTGKLYPITSLSSKQYALFPHFRSDGWLYMEVLDTVNDKRLVIASDAAVLLKKADPIR